MKGLDGYLARGYYASRDELRERIPELHPLKDKSIAVIGLGCLGAPSALEFAKAGIRRIHLVDHDTVDPATAVRWPVGFRAAGHNKADLLHGIIRRDYPYTESKPFPFRMGRARAPEIDSTSDMEIIEDILRGVNLVYDATVELGVQHFLSDRARALGTTYIGVSSTLGGWGGKIIRIRPHPESGCWFCYRLYCDSGGIPEPPSAPDQQGRVQPAGCADPTFTGAGFDMLHIALAGVRMAVSTLCEGAANAYPKSAWDVLHIRLRGDDGTLAVPTCTTHEIPRHPECKNPHVLHDKQ